MSNDSLRTVESNTQELKMMIKNSCKMVTNKKMEPNVALKMPTGKAIKWTIPFHVVVVIFLSSTICTGAPISIVSRFDFSTTVVTCSKNFDFIPARYRRCSDVVPVFCFKKVDVCYPVEALGAIMPCLIEQHHPGILQRISRCSVLAKLHYTKIGLVCSTTDDLKAFYACFNDGI